MALFFNTNLLRAPSVPLSPSKQLINYSSLSVRCSSNQQSDGSRDSDQDEPKKEKKLSKQSSWEIKDADGNDYLYRLGAEADNMNIAVGARAGFIDSLFAGNFLGKDCKLQFCANFVYRCPNFFVLCLLTIIVVFPADIVFDYRQKVTRSFQYLQGDYYIAPVFLVHCSFVIFCILFRYGSREN